jgi:hypothetical protein
VNLWAQTKSHGPHDMESKKKNEAALKPH